jgi:hypothetical protein
MRQTGKDESDPNSCYWRAANFEVAGQNRFGSIFAPSSLPMPSVFNFLILEISESGFTFQRFRDPSRFRDGTSHSLLQPHALVTVASRTLSHPAAVGRFIGARSSGHNLTSSAPHADLVLLQTLDNPFPTPYTIRAALRLWLCWMSAELT